MSDEYSVGLGPLSGRDYRRVGDLAVGDCAMKGISDVTNLWGREPAAVLGFIQAVIVLIVVFGVDLPQGAEGAILAVSAAFLALLTRSQVTPTSKLPPIAENEPS